MKRMKLLSVVAIMMALIFAGTVSMPVLASATGIDQNAVSEEVQVVEEDDNDSEVLSSKAMAAALVVGMVGVKLLSQLQVWILKWVKSRML